MTRAPVAFSHRKKDINLSVALRFGKLIESNCPDVKVIYTRKDDRFVTLHERAAIANRNKADLFISVHTNAVARGHRAGFPGLYPGYAPSQGQPRRGYARELRHLIREGL